MAALHLMILTLESVIGDQGGGDVWWSITCPSVDAIVSLCWDFGSRRGKVNWDGEALFLLGPNDARCGLSLCIVCFEAATPLPPPSLSPLLATKVGSQENAGNVSNRRKTFPTGQFILKAACSVISRHPFFFFFWYFPIVTA